MNNSENRFYVFGEYRMDVKEQILYRHGEPVPLTNKVFDLLAVLVINNGRVVTKDELMETVWADTIVEESNLKTSIHMLRKALGETNGEGVFIQTIPRRGYRFVADVTSLNGDEKKAVIATQRQQEIIIEEEIVIDDETGEEIIAPKALSTTQTVQESFIDRLRKNKLALFAALGICVLLIGSAAWMFFKWRNAQSRFSVDNIKTTPLISNSNISYAIISPDGKYLVYTLYINNDLSTLCVRQIATGNTTQLLTPARVSFWSYDFSPDGNFVYYSVHHHDDETRDGIYQISIFGGNSRKILPTAGGGLGISPDGKRIAYKLSTNAGVNVFTVNTDGSDVRGIISYPVGGGTTNITFMNWSPDGTRLILGLRKELGKGEIGYNVVEIYGDGGKEKVLVPEQKFKLLGANWLPDESGLVLLAEDAETEKMQIWLYSGGNMRRITNDANNYAGISLTKSGDIVATQQTSTANVWLTGQDGKDARIIPSVGTDVESLIWTPDGRLVLGLYEGGQLQLWIANADGSNKQQLTTMVGSKPFSPQITRDGKLILFATRLNGGRQLWRMDLNGNDLTKLMDLDRTFGDFLIAPDGQSVILRLWTYEWGWTLYKQPLNGGERVKLTDKEVLSYDISPDGKLFAIELMDYKTKEHHTVIRSFESGETIKTIDISSHAELRWTRDGKALTYVLPQPKSGYEILLQPFDGASPVKQLTNFQSERIYRFDWSYDGKTLALVRGKMITDVVMIKISSDK